MIKKYILATIFIVLIGQSMWAKEVKIQLLASDYVEKPIVFFSYTDRITERKNSFTEAITDAKGACSVTFNINEQQTVYIQIENNIRYLIAEPGKKYQVKSFNEHINNRLIVNDDGINQQINSFDTALNTLITNNFSQIYMMHDDYIIDTIIKRMKEKFTIDKNTFLETYKHIRYTLLAVNKKDFPINDFLENYLPSIEIDTKHPLTRELYQTFFKNYLKKNNFDEYYANGNFQNILDLATDSKLPIKGIELFLLSELKQQFDQKQDLQKNILKGFDLMIQKGSDQKIKEIAQELKAKFENIIIGDPFPELGLANRNGEAITIEDLKGTPTYIYFGSTSSPNFSASMKMLTWMKETYKNTLNYVVVSCNEDFEKAKEIIKDDKTVLLLDGNADFDELQNKYRIETFPRAYLVDESGILVIAPALLPQSRFYQQYGSWLKTKK